ncbi:putative O-glycosylation ligase, exosortase A system-associated [Croceicoccus estronivorus]|uniref:DUF5935 domain-containing protein n=1 Tax=Croceicoccus estronivorus TaxID=1172626 RepID=UPI00082C1A1A|nr:DUF5935 domain-containing protein [Croceicoccus estronivorus]OCC23871.1 putative O-glycosylation ligase, exosortase A system-associated [Croceicoccus estronivorus]
MLELALLAFWGGFLLLGLKRPFLWVLAYIYVDLFAPQRIGWAILPSIPLSLITFVAVFGGWLVLDNKVGSRFTFRQGLMLALLILCALSLTWADFPTEAADKWSWVWKALVFAIFLPLTLTNRLRLEAVALTMVLAVGVIAIDGGIKTVAGGGGYGTLSFFGVSDNSGIYEGSIISCAAICLIPLILWLARHGTIFPPDWRVRLFAAALIFACLLIPVGTQARTGLVCIAVLGTLLLRSVRHRFLYMAFAGVALMVAIPFLPQSYTERMATITDHQGDQSASTRLAVWKWTLGYVAEHPFGGGFNAYLGNRLDFETKETQSDGSSTVVETQEITDQGRAYHSSYFEMLGEEGWLGLVLWLWLHALGLWHMERIRRSWKNHEDPGMRWRATLATTLQQSQIVYLVGALFVGIAYQPFMYVIIGMQCGLWSMCRADLRLAQSSHLSRRGSISPEIHPSAVR